MPFTYGKAQTLARFFSTFLWMCFLFLSLAKKFRTHHQDQGEKAQEQRGTIGAHILAFVQSTEDEQRDRFRASLDPTTDHEDRPKFSQRPGEGENHSVDESPAQRRKGHHPKG